MSSLNHIQRREHQYHRAMHNQTRAVWSAVTWIDYEITIANAEITGDGLSHITRQELILQPINQSMLRTAAKEKSFRFFTLVKECQKHQTALEDADAAPVLKRRQRDIEQAKSDMGPQAFLSWSATYGQQERERGEMELREFLRGQGNDMRNFVSSCKKRHWSKLQRMLSEEDKVNEIAAFGAYISRLSSGFRKFYGTTWPFPSMLYSPQDTLVGSQPSSRKVTLGSNSSPDLLALGDMSGSSLEMEASETRDLYAEWPWPSMLHSPQETLVCSQPSSRKVTPGSDSSLDAPALVYTSGSPLEMEVSETRDLYAEWDISGEALVQALNE